MATGEGFWTLLSRYIGAAGSWSASSAEIAEMLRRDGLEEATANGVYIALANAARDVPDWPWDARVAGDVWRFTPKP